MLKSNRMKLNHFRDVVAVVERGSLRSAARHVGVTQPAITRSIRELENELGATLFERRSTGMVLTPIGEAFFRRAAGIQSEVQRVRDEIEQLKGKGVGIVSIGLSTLSHIALLPRVIGPFQRRFPNVRLRIAEGMFPAIERDLQEGTIDFYVGPLASEGQPAELLAEQLFENRRLVFGRRDHPLAGATSLAELNGARWVTGALTLISEDELAPLFVRRGLPLPTIGVSGQTLLSMIVVAASSDMLTMLPQQWLPILENTGLIKNIPVSETLAAATICIVRRAAMPLTPVAEHLVNLFRRAAIKHSRMLPVLPALTA